ncbi:MAG: histidine kinase [Lachnospiraceae bacterium]|nr:histidine kinase [Lachnospiraceae bacterium]
MITNASGITMKPFGLRLRVFLLITFLLTVGIGVLTYVNLRLSSRVLTRQIEEANEKSIRNIRDDLDSQIRYMRNSITRIYDYKDFISALRSDEPYEDIHSNFISLARSFATESFSVDQKVDALYLYTADHRCISYYRRADTPYYRYPTDIYTEDPQMDYNAEIVREYVDSDETDLFISGYYNTARESDVVRFVYKIYVENRGRMVGYIVCDTDVRALTNRIKTFTYYEGQSVYIQPFGDRIVLSFGEAEAGQAEIYDSISEEISLTEYSGAIRDSFTERLGDRVVLLTLPRYQLAIYSILPERILRDRSRSLFTNLIIAGTILIIAVALVSWIASSVLGYRYNLMRQQAEFRALQAQINPHFLYNTLGAMSGIARKSGCNEVSDLSVALSDIFRYSMNTKEDIVPLYKEIAHIRNYLYVMSARMQNEIHSEINIRSKDMNIELPKLTLQPIVENAIKHGLSEIRGEKKIVISSEERNGKIAVSIADNGCGMDADAMNRWLSSDDKDKMSEGDDSIGLKNIHRRIGYYCGKGYGLVIENVPEGSRVTVLLKPKKETE